MNLAEKVEIAKRSIDSISRHDDEDAAVRAAILAQVAEHIEIERKAIEARVESRLKQLRASRQL